MLLRLIGALVLLAQPAQASCIIDDKIVQGLANLYVASRECPRMRPLSDERYALLLIASGGIAADEVNEACGKELAPLAAVAMLAKTVKPTFCDDIRMVVRKVPSFRALNLLR